MPTRGDEERPDNIGDRLRMMETVVAYLADRQSDTEQLSDATTRLAESTSGVEDALRAVGEVRKAQEAQAEQIGDVQAQAAEVAKLAVPKSRLRLTVAVVAALVLVACLFGYGYFGLKGSLYTRCTERLNYDRANHLAVGGDLEWKRSLLEQTRQNAPLNAQVLDALPAELRKPLREAQARQVASLERAVSKAQTAYDQGIIADCSAYK